MTCRLPLPDIRGWMNLIINLDDIFEQYCRYDKQQAPLRLGRIKVYSWAYIAPFLASINNDLFAWAIFIAYRGLFQHDRARHCVCG